jgi:aminoglycoside phosphotransferase (APT) family kinase protein
MWPYTEPETLELVRQIAREIASDSGGPVFLSKGSNNEVFLVPSGSGEFVVRVCGDWREVVTRREQWCYERAGALGIPGPVVLGIGKWEKLPYLALSLVRGCLGTEFEPCDHLWETLGRYAAKINDIPFDDEGERLYGPESAWREKVEACLDPDRFSWVSSQIGWEPKLESDARSRLTRFLETDLRIGLSHGDIDPRNAIVGEDGEVCLIDWCCSRRGPIPHVDLYNILRETEPRGKAFMAYLSGYGLSPEGFAAIEGDVHAFGTLELIADMLWAARDRPDLLPERRDRLAAHVSRLPG